MCTISRAFGASIGGAAKIILLENAALQKLVVSYFNHKYTNVQYKIVISYSIFAYQLSRTDSFGLGMTIFLDPVAFFGDFVKIALV